MNWLAYVAKFLILAGLALILSLPVYAQVSISQQISRQVADNISKNLSANLIIPQLRIRNSAGAINDLSISADGKYMVLVLEDSTARVWDLSRGIQRQLFKGKGQRFTSAVVGVRSNRVYGGQGKGVISVLGLITGEYLSEIKAHDGEIKTIRLSDDESILTIVYQDGTVVLWDTIGSKNLSSLLIDPDALTSMDIKKNGSVVVTGGTDKLVRLWNVETGKETGRFMGHGDDIIKVAFLDAANKVISVDEEGTIRIWDVATDVLHTEIKGSDETVSAMGVHGNSNVTALGLKTGQIKLIDLAGKKEIRTLTGHEIDIKYLAFIPNGGHLMSADVKGSLRLWDVTTGKQLLQIISTKTGWTVVDNSGRFDSSESAISDVSWQAADQSLQLDSFSDQYYEPGLLVTHLEHDKNFLASADVKIQQGIKLPPSVSLIFPDSHETAGKNYLVKVSAQDNGGGIEAVRFFHNGKRVSQDAFVEEKEFKENDRLIQEFVFRITPLVGTNTFKASVANNMGIESIAAEASRLFTGPAVLKTLHVVAIGIDKYKDSRLDLDYSVADATSIISQLANKKRVKFDAVKHYTIFDDKATKKNILGTLNGLTDIEQQDKIVVYLAGHGLTLEGEWYFLPYETIYQQDEKEYARVGISATEFKGQMVRVKAQSIMVLIDACQSGQSLKVFRKFSESQRRYSRNLSRGVGVTVLAATRQDQDAAEIVELGHGLFTFVVLKGLSGEADRKHQDGYVSAHEVVDFSKKTIPHYLTRYSKATQEPTAFTLGPDFNLVAKNKLD